MTTKTPKELYKEYELILNFMGYEMEYDPTYTDVYNNKIPTYLADGIWKKPKQFKFSESVDSLIPVINKTRELDKQNFNLTKKENYLRNNLISQRVSLNVSIYKLDINKIYKAVIDYITEYNRLKNEIYNKI